MQKLQKDYDEDARRLMEIKTKQQQMSKQAQDLDAVRENMDKELAEQIDKIERA